MKPSARIEKSSNKHGMHPRNRHRTGYDFDALIATCAELQQWVKRSAYDVDTIDFSNPEAVLTLNRALLIHDYGITHWSIPAGFLCPPIPGRADHIHHLADLLAENNNGKIPRGSAIKCLDIGVGANCIYPIIGHHEYGWTFIGSEIEPAAIESAEAIIKTNSSLRNHIQIRKQKNPKSIFNDMIQPEEYFDLTLCNPPFHSSAEEAERGTLRKINNLTGNKGQQPALNFGGGGHELWCEGGEQEFIRRMIDESRQFAHSCMWFTTLVSKKSNLNSIYHALRSIEVSDLRTIEMAHGNKVSRIVAWTFFDSKKQSIWRQHRWMTK